MYLDESIRTAIKKLSTEYDSFYLYYEQGIIQQISTLKKCFPQVEFLYSMKCNSNPYLIKSIVSCGIGIDAASQGEVELAHECGVENSKIFYSAPGKTIKDLQMCMDKSEIIVDSLGEIERISRLSEDKYVDIGIRINPEFTFDNDTGITSKFGIDEAEALEFIENNPYKNIRITGLHVHVKSQELSHEKLADYHRKLIYLAERVETILGYQLSYINMGSGLGIAYSEDSQGLNMEMLGQLFDEITAEYIETHKATRILIETGRYIAGPNGFYVTHVVDRKISHGVTYAILQNTLNGFIRPSIAQFVENYVEKYAYENGAGKTLAGTEPLYSGSKSVQILTLDNDNEESETVTLVGNLCTGADVVAQDINLPRLSVGDLVIFPNAGAYGAVLTPMQFSSQSKPSQIVLTVNGEFIV